MQCACAILPSVACLPLPYFPNIISWKVNFSRKRFLNTKCGFWFSLQFLSEIFLILRRIQRGIIIKVHTSSYNKLEVKVTLLQALRLCTGRTAHRGSRDIALLFHDYGTRRGWVVSVTPRPLFTPGNDPVSIVQEAGWVPGPVWTGAENFGPTGTLSPDLSPRSQSLYWLSYPAQVFM